MEDSLHAAEYYRLARVNKHLSPCVLALRLCFVILRLYHVSHLAEFPPEPLTVQSTSCDSWARLNVNAYLPQRAMVSSSSEFRVRLRCLKIRTIAGFFLRIVGREVVQLTDPANGSVALFDECPCRIKDLPEAELDESFNPLDPPNSVLCVPKPSSPAQLQVLAGAVTFTDMSRSTTQSLEHREDSPELLQGLPWLREQWLKRLPLLCFQIPGTAILFRNSSVCILLNPSSGSASRQFISLASEKTCTTA